MQLIVENYSLNGYSETTFMNTTIICPHCKETIDISEALEHEYASEFADKHKQEIETAKKQSEEKAFKKAAQEAELRIKDKEMKLKKLKQNRKQQEEILINEIYARTQGKRWTKKIRNGKKA